MAAAAQTFLGTLDAAQRAKAHLPFDSEERFNWFYIPKDRVGLPLKQMTAPQREATMALLHAGLSEKGYTKAEAVRALEPVLAEIEKNPVRRDPELYYVSIFGDPTPAGTWGWRYEGHHLSQNWTVVRGESIASSPQFFGSNPAEVRDGPKKGTRVLAAEEDLARALLERLTEAQRAKAVISAEAPDDMLTANNRKAAMQEDRGLSHEELTPEQRGLLMAVIEEYAGAQQRSIAQKRLEAVRTAGLGKVKFAWMGGLERGKRHYYRIQGPTFLIEYDNTQNDANHIHAVWRDFTGDFGLDSALGALPHVAASRGRTAPARAPAGPPQGSVACGRRPCGSAQSAGGRRVVQPRPQRQPWSLRGVPPSSVGWGRARCERTWSVWRWWDCLLSDLLVPGIMSSRGGAVR